MIEYDVEEFAERWEKLSEDEYLEFDNIPDSEKLHPNEEICALMKIYSLVKDPSKFDYHAEHDELFLASPSEFKGPMTDEDIIYLSRCGIHYDSDEDCLVDFC